MPSRPARSRHRRHSTRSPPRSPDAAAADPPDRLITISDHRSGVCSAGYRGVMAQFVDWDLAAATAGALGKAGPRASYEEATEVVADLRRLTEEAAGHVSDYTGLRSQVSHPPVRIVDRRDWAAVNV